MSSTYLRTYPPNPNTTRGTATKISSHGDKLIYANGKSIIIRDLSNPANDLIYSQHTQPTTVARISPTGYYVASADVQGNVRIWDIAGTDQILKLEKKAIGGKVNDLAWDGESKRIIAVGEGREKFGAAFQFDTGTSAGEITGHSKVLNSVAIRQQRPFRAATAGDDGLIVFHQGAPYKFVKHTKVHTNFVHSVAYAPSGSHFVSTGADYKVLLWDGTTGDHVAEFENAHKGGVFAGSWSPDSKSIVTSSADGTVKLWDVETRKATTTWTLGSDLAFQQLGNTWTPKDAIVSLSLDGLVNVFDPRNGSGPARTLHGAQKPITAATIVPSPPTFFSGSGDGRIHALSLESDIVERISGTGHTSLVSGLAEAQGAVWSVAYDDKAKEIDVSSTSFSKSIFVQTTSQPKGIAVSSQDGHIFVAEAKHVEVLKAGQKVATADTSYAALSIDVHGDLVAVGGDDAKVHLYTWSNAALKDTGVLEGPFRGQVSATAFSPDGSLLAVGDSSGKIVVVDVKERKPIITRWTSHSARIYSLSWTEDNAHIASASLDTHIYIWSIAKVNKNIAILNAVPGGAWSARWIPATGDAATQGKRKLIGVGSDAAIRIWEVSFHA
ncbi:hypothetical protein M422DRAFT_249597 [Sphaerobolus stellatus SS14]|uniref:Anaphase-promoting complex subunit 4-like WD40 domain-containing protein n=1 Tax=Sphaerobolus stellatus (strain SS14) TaxID=990650 RepID=A0A0C9W535_SPHS4|nr:hypothetical protein M422DRAFT_249597 [Sphaerobolus stellatus SS14]